MTTKEDLKIFPVYQLINKRLVKINAPECWNQYKTEPHHFIKQQSYKRNPEKYKELQKIIFVSPECHRDIHSFHSKFYEKWGVYLDDVIYRRGA